MYVVEVAVSSDYVSASARIGHETINRLSISGFGIESTNRFGSFGDWVYPHVNRISNAVGEERIND